MATTTPARPRALDSPSASSGNSGRIGPVHEGTLVELFRRQAATRGDKPAMFHRAGDLWAPITWNAYAQEARELAGFFIDAGLQEGQHIAVWSFNRPEFVITSTATMLSGACTAPLYQTLSAPEAGYVLGHSDAPIAVVENEHLLAKVLEVRDRLPALRRVVLMDGAAPAVDGLAVVSWEDALRRGRDALGQLAVELDRRSDAVQTSDVATLVYTSGTTGPPKAVMATHGNLIAAINALAPIVDLSVGRPRPELPAAGSHPRAPEQRGPPVLRGQCTLVRRIHRRDARGASRHQTDLLRGGAARLGEDGRDH